MLYSSTSTNVSLLFGEQLSEPNDNCSALEVPLSVVGRFGQFSHPCKEIPCQWIHPELKSDTYDLYDFVDLTQYDFVDLTQKYTLVGYEEYCVKHNMRGFHCLVFLIFRACHVKLLQVSIGRAIFWRKITWCWPMLIWWCAFCQKRSADVLIDTPSLLAHSVGGRWKLRR